MPKKGRYLANKKIFIDARVSTYGQWPGLEIRAITMLGQFNSQMQLARIAGIRLDEGDERKRNEMLLIKKGDFCVLVCETMRLIRVHYRWRRPIGCLKTACVCVCVYICINIIFSVIKHHSLVIYSAGFKNKLLLNQKRKCHLRERRPVSCHRQ